MKTIEPNPIWMTDPSAALLEIEQRLGKSGQYYGATGQFKALSQLPRNLDLLEGDTLNLTYTLISDISGLSKVPQLRKLTLGPEISDLSVLPLLPYLEEFEAPRFHSKITDFSPLRECKNLKRVMLDVSAATSLSFLDHSSVEHVILHGYAGQALPKLPDLKSLSISPVSTKPADVDLSSLSMCAGLGRLSIALPVFNLPTSLPSLTGLSVTLRDAAELCNIARFSDLKALKLDCSEISSLSPILSCEKLRTLEITHASIHDATCLVDLPELQEIALSDNPLTEIARLSHLPLLNRLSANKTGVETLAGWNSNAELSWLDLSDTKVSDISPLFGSRINRLSLNKTKLSDLNGVSEINGLYRLYVNETNVAEVPMSERHLSLFHEPEYYDPRDGDVFQFTGTPLAESGFALLPPKITKAPPNSPINRQSGLRKLFHSLWPGKRDW